MKADSKEDYKTASCDKYPYQTIIENKCKGEGWAECKVVHC